MLCRVYRTNRDGTAIKKTRLRLIRVVHHRMQYPESFLFYDSSESELESMGLVEGEISLPPKGYFTASYSGEYTPEYHNPITWWELEEERQKAAEEARRVEAEEARKEERRRKRNTVHKDYPLTSRRPPKPVLVRLLDPTPNQMAKAVMERWPSLHINATSGRVMCKRCKEWGKTNDLGLFIKEHKPCRNKLMDIYAELAADEV